jgi:hypothetical protein
VRGSRDLAQIDRLPAQPAVDDGGRLDRAGLARGAAEAGVLLAAAAAVAEAQPLEQIARERAALIAYLLKL